jgi:O-antigen/teichoic acid export membrane protein
VLVGADIKSLPANVTNKHIRGSALLLAGRLISLGLNLASQVLIVRYLSKLDYGAFAFALAIVSMASSIILVGLHRSISRFLPIFEEAREYGKMIGSIILVFTTVLALGISLTLIIYGFEGVLLHRLDIDPLALSILMILIFVAPAHSYDSLLVTLFAVFSGARAVFYPRHVIAPGLKLCAVLTIMGLGGSVQQLAVAYLVAGILGTTVCFWLFVRILRSKELWGLFSRTPYKYPFRELRQFALPLFYSEMVGISRQSMVVLFIGVLFSSSGVADFRAVLPIALLNQAVAVNFGFLFTPNAARLFAQNDFVKIDELYWRTAAWITAITFPIFAITFSLAEPLSVFLFGAEYASSGLILSVLSVGFFFHAALGFSVDTLNVFGKLHYLVKVDTFILVATLLANLWVIPLLGPLGGAIVVSASLITHKILYLIGISLQTEIQGFNRDYLKLYLAVIMASLALLAIHILASPPTYLLTILVLPCWLFVLAISRNLLDIESTFPELQRIKWLRKLTFQQG